MKARSWLYKEWLESIRSHRLLIAVLVFLFLAIAQPVAFHLMPTILSRAGLPEGMVIEMPPMTASEIIAGVFDQYSQIGVLTIVFITMGMFSREIESGAAAFADSLGISRFSYFGAKWTVAAFMTGASVFIGILGAAYYTDILFPPVGWGPTVLAALVYSLHLLFVLTLNISVNAVLSHPLVSAVSALALHIGLSVSGAFLPEVAPWLPGYAASMAKAVLKGAFAEPPWRLFIPVLWVGLVFVAGYTVLKQRDF